MGRPPRTRLSAMRGDPDDAVRVVTIPSSDGAFAADVRRIRAAQPGTASALEVSIRRLYPGARVRVQRSAEVVLAGWYVYRDGWGLTGR